MYLYEPNARFLFILMLIPIFGFFPRFKDTGFYFYLLLTLCFVAGSISINTGINYDFLRQFIELNIWAMLFYVAVTSDRLKLPGIGYLISFILVAIISGFFNEKSVLELLLYLRKFLFVVAAFYLAVNVNLRHETLRNLFYFILALAAFQVFVNVQKFITIGQQEDYIGSMALSGGSLTTIFSLVGIAFSFSYYLFEKKRKYIYWIIGFIAFAIIGEKRGIIVYLPILLLAQYFYYMRINKIKLSRRSITGLFGIFLGLMVFVYIAIRLNPSLNPTGEIGGDFDLDYLAEFSTKFTNTESDTFGGNDSFSRGLVYLQTYYLITTEFTTLDIFFGKGPADIMMSRFSPYYGDFLNEEAILLEKYKIGYGGRSGLIYTFIQTGILGLISYVFLIRAFFVNVKKIIIRTPNLSKEVLIIGLALLGSYFAFLMDFLTYSRVFNEKISIFIPVALVLGYFFSHYRNRHSVLKTNQ